MKYYAQTADDGDEGGLPEENGQLLSDHLRSVSKLAGKFGRSLGLKVEASLVGLLHNFWKYSLRLHDIYNSGIKLNPLLVNINHMKGDKYYVLLGS